MRGVDRPCLLRRVRIWLERGFGGRNIVPDRKVNKPSKEARDEELQERLLGLTVRDTAWEN
jgi:hypothetical protein